MDNVAESLAPAMWRNALGFDYRYGMRLTALAYTPPIGVARQAKQKASLANEFWVGWASIAHRNVAEIGGACRVGNKLPTMPGFGVVHSGKPYDPNWAIKA